MRERVRHPAGIGSIVLFVKQSSWRDDIAPQVRNFLKSSPEYSYKEKKPMFTKGAWLEP
jgi:hypothetical protein